MRSYSGRPRRFALYRCDFCGEEFEHCTANTKNMKSCGCKQSTKPIRHGDSTKSILSPLRKLHGVWSGMKQRCLNPKSTRYSRYGGRGISVCQEWFSYERFKEWAVNNGYKDGLIIDRINNDGDYEPSNCRWVDSTTSLLNRDLSNIGCKSRKLDKDKVDSIRNSTGSATAIAAQFGVSSSLVYGIRANRRWKNEHRG